MIGKFFKGCSFRCPTNASCENQKLALKTRWLTFFLGEERGEDQLNRIFSSCMNEDDHLFLEIDELWETFRFSKVGRQ